jgi:hypothetical protein
MRSELCYAMLSCVSLRHCRILLEYLSNLLAACQLSSCLALLAQCLLLQYCSCDYLRVVHLHVYARRVSWIYCNKVLLTLVTHIVALG